MAASTGKWAYGQISSRAQGWEDEDACERGKSRCACTFSLVSPVRSGCCSDCIFLFTTVLLSNMGLSLRYFKILPISSLTIVLHNSSSDHIILRLLDVFGLALTIHLPYLHTAPAYLCHISPNLICNQHGYNCDCSLPRISGLFCLMVGLW